MYWAMTSETLVMSAGSLKGGFLERSQAAQLKEILNMHRSKKALQCLLKTAANSSEERSAFYDNKVF